MKKWPWTLAIVLVLLLGGGGWWFWSLGTVPARAAQGIALSVYSGSVQVRRGASGAWTAATTGEELKNGDVVRTSSDGAATIRYFGIGESRLASNSEITIQSTNSGTVDFQLSGGRIWTRLLRLLDLDNSVSVRTNTVAATVRGTAFDVQANAAGGSTVLVTDSVVDLSPATGSRTVPLHLVEGSMADVSAQGSVVKTDKIADDAKLSSWFLDNTKRDAIFEEQARTRIAQDLASLGGPAPDSAADGIARLSERLHLAVVGTDAPDLYASYAARRLFAIRDLVNRGKSGLALQVLARLDDEMSVKFAGPNGAAYRRALRGSLTEITRLLENTDPLSPLYRLKQRVEDFAVAAGEEPGASEFAVSAKLDAIQSSLMTAGIVMQTNTSTARDLLDSAEQGLKNAAPDISSLPPVTSPTRLASIKNKVAAFDALAKELEDRLTTLNLPTTPITSTTSTSEVPTPTPTTTQPTPTPTPKPTPTVPAINRITLAATPNPATIGDTVRLVVTGVRADGSSVDVTSFAKFQTFGNLGALNGPTYLATAAGSVTIQATVTSQGSALMSSVSLFIQLAPRSLTSLTLTPLGQTTITGGGRLGFSVDAMYSDGSKADVTAKAIFSLSDATLGTMAGSVFSSAQSTTGAAQIETVTAKYSELGFSATNAVDVTIH